MSTLLAQVREDAARIADEAAPEIRSAIEHIGSVDSLSRMFVALVGRLEESVPGLVKPGESPLPETLTTHVPSDEEAAEAAANQVPANAGDAQQVPPNAEQVQGSQAQSAQTMEERLTVLENQLKGKDEVIAALQSAITPKPAEKPAVSDETQG